jgi:hypothetical protein
MRKEFTFTPGQRVRFKIGERTHEGTIIRRHGDVVPPMYVVGEITPRAKEGPQLSLWWHDLELVLTDGITVPRAMRFRPGDRVRLIVD